MQNKWRAWIRGLWLAPSALKKYAQSDGGIKGFMCPIGRLTRKPTRAMRARGATTSTEQYQTTNDKGERVTESRTHRVGSNVSGNVSFFRRCAGVGQQKSIWRQGIRQRRRSRRSTHSPVSKWAAWPASAPVGNMIAAISRLHDRWNTRGAGAVSGRYVTGFQAEAYQVGFRTAFGTAKQLIDTKIEQLVRADIGGDHQHLVIEYAIQPPHVQNTSCRRCGSRPISMAAKPTGLWSMGRRAKCNRANRAKIRMEDFLFGVQDSLLLFVFLAVFGVYTYGTGKRLPFVGLSKPGVARRQLRLLLLRQRMQKKATEPVSDGEACPDSFAATHGRRPPAKLAARNEQLQRPLDITRRSSIAVGMSLRRQRCSAPPMGPNGTRVTAVAPDLFRVPIANLGPGTGPGRHFGHLCFDLVPLSPLSITDAAGKSARMFERRAKSFDFSANSFRAASLAGGPSRREAQGTRTRFTVRAGTLGPFWLLFGGKRNLPPGYPRHGSEPRNH